MSLPTPAAPMRRSTAAEQIADALFATPTGELAEDLDEAQRRYEAERDRRRERPTTPDGMTRRH